MKTIFRIILAAVLLFTISSANLWAQKEQVAFSPGLFTIEKDQAAQLPVLEKYLDGYQKSQLFRDEAGLYYLNVQYSKRGKDWVEEHSFSKEELDLLRDQLLDDSFIDGSERNRSKNGRAYLITSVTLHSIAQGSLIGSTMRRTVYDPIFQYSYSETRPLGRAFPLIGAAAGFTSSLMLTKNRNIPLSASNMHFNGSLLGYAHGALLGALLTGDNGSSNTYLLLTSGMSLAEGWTMYHIAKKYKFDYDRSTAWNSGNFWGTGQGVFLTFALAGEDANSRLLGGLGLAGGIAGTVLFDHLHKKSPRTTGDYRAMNMLGLVGAVWVPAINPDLSSARGASIALMSSSAIAFAAGHFLTDQTSFSKAEGGLIVLGTWVGSLLGTGTGILLDSDDYTTGVRTTTLGATIGWVVSYLYFRNNRLDGGLFGSRIERRARSNFNFQINPGAIGMMRSSPEQQSAMMVRGRGMDMLSCSLAF